MNNKKVDSYIFYTSFALFIISLTQESYCTNQCGDSLAVFLVGGLGVLFEIGALTDKYLNINTIGEVDYTIGATFSWLANPALLIAWLTYKESKTTSLVFTMLSLALMLSFLMFDKVIDNEAGHYNKIVNYKAGYWLWLSSSAVLAAGALVKRRITHHNKV
ncbi:hypothetical protein CLV24_111157 [Pontibacter ummariensis]|uniref:Uncharacterized protein n=1 Tax=Pontibacter ummariensis TaxID=1610492 RepID=A0A239GPL6_9BACT|nr:hypothetical protein [Pontibacter ummariensis]PRY11362.1 hypothetical protein CLV24_111157 [Pontibacter ummariensis]SNS70762.1 hypothetical protein SAMN06296052_111157 [Pontibacter ummariensis]